MGATPWRCPAFNSNTETSPDTNDFISNLAMMWKMAVVRNICGLIQSGADQTSRLSRVACLLLVLVELLRV